MPLGLHPIEGAWRRFRGGPSGDLLRRSLDMRESFRRHLGLARYPAEVILPGAILWNLAAMEEAQVRGQQTGDRLPGGSLIVSTVHTWAAYRESKTIYEFTSALIECLRDCPWPDATPTAAIRMPSRCPVMTIPSTGGTIYLAAAYDLVTGAEKSGALELRISKFEDNLWVPVGILHLTRPTLQECLEAAGAEARAHGAPAEYVSLWRNNFTGLALTLLLYLAGEPDVVRMVHRGEKPVKESIRRRDPERYKDLAEPAIHQVGGQFQNAIERWEVERRSTTAEATGRTVRPHLRRAHSHLYWTGSGRQTPRVRFLLPISVRGGKLVEEPETPSEVKVR